ncbi:nucleotide exchange factor GrpE [Telmatospirillum sp. J64-1]|uniref:nucleotide exchange factor GrpE n=1 Tax=Telmatospirillum sp. J64-1 TaxID=2502183 RepID=UPI00115D7D2F|nr:nucleotide exchange factor GrpE [Telmatospirillum sp. J64-1]
MSQEKKDDPQSNAPEQQATPNPISSDETVGLGGGAEEAAEAPAPEPSAREAELEAEIEKLKKDVLYAAAETENVRRRLTQQAEERGKYAVTNFARDMLAVADNLRRALEALPADQADSDMAKNLIAGVEMTERELLNIFERHGIRRVPAMGERFDPNLHQAMMEVEDASKPSGTVVVEMQAGYVIQDRLLRPAMVGVSKGGPKPGPGEGGEQKVDTTA